MSCGVGRRPGSDMALLWLWCRPVATAPIRPLAWEPLYATGAALGKTKKKFFFFTLSEEHWEKFKDIKQRNGMTTWKDHFRYIVEKNQGCWSRW